MEATYGNRVHEHVEQREEELLNIIVKTIIRGGTVVIPSFAVGRTQEIIYELNKYYESHHEELKSKTQLLHNIPVYVDSPLAMRATEVFKKNAGVFDEEARALLMKGDNPLAFTNLHFTQSVEDSKALNFSEEPKIIISSSGMCDAGRIKHHLKHNLWKKTSSIVFVGYQAEGTLGRRIRDGAREVKIFGEQIHVNAEVYSVEGFSGHADKIGLMNWLKHFNTNPKVFIVHGEEEAKNDFAKEVEETLGLKCIVPEYNQVYEIKKRQIAEIREPSITPESPVSEERINELLNGLEGLKELFEHTLKQIKGRVSNDQNDPITMAKYSQINNVLLHLESDFVDLSMLSGK